MPQQRKKRQLDIGLSSSRELSVMNKKSKKCIENLPNELFYELFEYLDGYDIYYSFYNLNHRFQELITNSSMLFKIKFNNQSKLDVFKSIPPVLDHQIISLVFSERLSVNQFFINRSFPNLQSISLYEISQLKLSICFFYFKSLSCLRSLTIYLDYSTEDLGDIYQLIFQLSSLRYLKVNVNDEDDNDDDLLTTMPWSTPNQCSSIEHLSIYHRINLNEMMILLSYTPRLSHLTCINIVCSNDLFERQLPSISLVNLVHLDVSLYKLKFIEFENFLIRYGSNLRSIDVSICDQDKSYLDANHWEKLIVESLPRLIRFRFCYTEIYHHNFQLTSQHFLIHQFTSSFWKKHQWNFTIGIEDDEIIYQIIPQRKRLFNNPEYYLMNDWIQLDIWNSVLVKRNQTLMEKIRPLIESIRITYLDIDSNRVSSMSLIKLFNCLPNLHSIRIHSLPSKRTLFNSNKDLWKLFIQNNQILRVNLPEISDLTRIDLIIELFPLAEHLTLEMNILDDFESIIQKILSKLKRKQKNHKINSICFVVSQIENDKIQQIENWIRSKKLLKIFTLSRIYDKCFLKWK